MSYTPVKTWIAALKRGPTPVREIRCPTDPTALLAGQVFRMDAGEKASIILKEDSAVELGPPERASFQTVCRVRGPETPDDGLITLIGPDLADARGREIPFAQVLWVGGKDLGDRRIRELERKLLISNRLPGYMVRWAGDRIWARVGKSALERGFSFEVLGRNLMAHFKRNFPMIRSLEILFVTSSDDQVTELRRFFSAGRNERKVLPKKKSLEGCTYEIDCADCPNQPVCERIREMAERFGRIQAVNEKERRRLVRQILSAERVDAGPTDHGWTRDHLLDLPAEEGEGHDPIRG